MGTSDPFPVSIFARFNLVEGKGRLIIGLNDHITCWQED